MIAIKDNELLICINDYDWDLVIIVVMREMRDLMMFVKSEMKKDNEVSIFDEYWG